MMEKRDVLSLPPDVLADYFAKTGQPKYRAKQLFAWLHQQRVRDFDDMSNLPKPLREQLKTDFYIPKIEVARRQQSADGTVKYLFSLPDGASVETVAMFYEHGVSVCISTQVGCRMGCAFCASTVGGLERNLMPSEMLLQVYETVRNLEKEVDSVVLMGIGEPLDNFCNVLLFYDMITDGAGFGLANRKVSLSTCGLCDEIDRLAELKRQLTLSVSLHAATDEQRVALMPVNRQYGLRRLMESCKNYQQATGRRISSEYTVVAGFNDSESDADALAKLLRGTGSHINLIAVNTAREGFSATRANAMKFQTMLLDRGLNATVRRTLGADIDAACGQLRRRDQQERYEVSE